MRALLVFSVLLLSHVVFAQDTATAPATPAPAPAAPAATEPAAATEESAPVTIPSAFKSGIMVSPNFSLFKRELEQSVATQTPGTGPGSLSGDVSGTELGVKGGYVFEFGLFAGLNVMYNTGKDSAINDTIKTYAAGPSIGYHCNYTGLFLTATYHLFGKTDIGATGEYDEVTGLQFDVAYPIQLTDKINLGPQITWRRLDQKDGSNGLTDTKTKEFMPSISAWFYF